VLPDNNFVEKVYAIENMMVKTFTYNYTYIHIAAQLILVGI
jgi:hypothetical protein